jgi:hypothetical protein
MDLQNNDRMEEWFLIVGDWFRETGKAWYYAFVGLVVIAIPLSMFLNLVFESIMVSTIVPLKISYTESVKQPLAVVDRKIFDMGNGTYSGYARIKNPNSEWGVPEQAYAVTFKSASGAPVHAHNASTFILPGADKVIAFPRFSATSAPTTLDLSLVDSPFVRPVSMPTLSLEIQRRAIDLAANQSVVTAVILNRTPFKLARVDLPVLLFDAKNQVIGANYTNINDLDNNESRSFQYTWFNRINNVSRIEIVPELNIYNRDLFVSSPGTNPFDDIQ